jgi:integrase/recombinase XerD
VHNIVKKAVKALNLHRSLSAHDFRHFRATQLLREGMPLEVVQEFLGHADISTTRNIYAPVLGAHIVGEWLDNVDMSPGQAMQEQ